MRKKIVAGNWKMNKTFQEALDFFDAIDEEEADLPGVNVIIASPVIYLSELKRKLGDSYISLAAQNAHFEHNSALTGEVSFEMLQSIGINYCIVGHSERRTIFKETNQEVAQKTKAAIKNNIIPIVCCGETLAQRESKTYFETIENQLKFLSEFGKEEIREVIIAYEPVWAIGTGETATPQQAQEIHKYIRSLIGKYFNQEIADKTYILYGGSCKPANANALFSCKDIDGGLIGGASLNPNDFTELIQIAAKTRINAIH